MVDTKENPSNFNYKRDNLTVVPEAAEAGTKTFMVTVPVRGKTGMELEGLKVAEDPLGPLKYSAEAPKNC